MLTLLVWGHAVRTSVLEVIMDIKWRDAGAVLHGTSCVSLITLREISEGFGYKKLQSADHVGLLPAK